MLLDTLPITKRLTCKFRFLLELEVFAGWLGLKMQEVSADDDDLDGELSG
jgi:hypothetical protein